MSDLNLTINEGSDVYLAITETPAVVTLGAAVISGALASTVTVANTVTVALDSNSLSALENVTVTVGAAVSVSNFPASQIVAGTVTANASFALNDFIEGYDETAAQQCVAVHIKDYNNQILGASYNPFYVQQDYEYLEIKRAATVGFNCDGIYRRNILNASIRNGVIPIYSKIDDPSITFTYGNSTGYDQSNGWEGNDLRWAIFHPASGGSTGWFAPDSIRDLINLLDEYGGQFYYDNFGSGQTSTLLIRAVDLSGIVSGSVTIGWLPAISGTVTVGNSVTIGSLPAITGTVTANIVSVPTHGVTIANSTVTAVSYVQDGTSLGAELAQGIALGGGIPISGIVPISISSVTIGSLPAISGTVTAAAPNGTLTARFGTPTTANTAFATSAVTNTSRKYLLIQNVTTASNAITVGIGFTPTTTQGIQLTAGAGITFESSYIPTGAVYVLSSVTASNFTILEA